ncbi:unnamed protein product [Phytophthora fragariaefolia]|uniref:Unnamed protein product n=1 Tax=Phytophthora fragariaefolia TaxID=1490495 RepID=A0A9W6XQT4_9STRA|nr:unnamed protein product [Phytophthora fragariaefolia]
MTSAGTPRAQVPSAEAPVQLEVIDLSHQETAARTPREDDQILVKQADAASVDKPKSPPAPQTKVLFLDGARGLAAMLVVVQHSQEFVPNLHLGSVGVDVFFVLSSFLLTWIFMKKSKKLLAQRANLRTWMFVLADYFQKRFFRVYPLFFVTVVVLGLMSKEDQIHYFIGGRPDFNWYKTLTFSFEYRYHVFWTLPLEISYYFVIPVFVLGVLGMRRFWWVAALPLSVWIVYEGMTVYRQSHMPMRPHIATFLTGSLAAVVFVKLDLWMKQTNFTLRLWHTVLLRTVEWLSISMLLSVCFRGLLFNWVHPNPALPPDGFPYTSAFLAIIFVIEMIRPSWVSTSLEWNVLRFWGKISFSIYLMHSFIVENPTISAQGNYFDRFFSRLILILALSSATYYAIEYPSQLLAQRLSRFLTEKEKETGAKFTSLDGGNSRRQETV